MGRIEDRLSELELELPARSPPPGDRVPVRPGQGPRGLGYVSGHLPVDGAEVLVSGRVGDGLTVEQGYEAARLVGLSIFASLAATLGELDRVTDWPQGARARPVRTRLRHKPPAVINGFTDLVLEVWGPTPAVMRARRSAPNSFRSTSRSRSRRWSRSREPGPQRAPESRRRLAVPGEISRSSGRLDVRAAGRRTRPGAPADRAATALRRVDERVEERGRGQVGDRERLADQVLAVDPLELGVEAVERGDDPGPRRRGRVLAGDPEAHLYVGGAERLGGGAGGPTPLSGPGSIERPSSAIVGVGAQLVPGEQPDVGTELFVEELLQLERPLPLRRVGRVQGRIRKVLLERRDDRGRVADIPASSWSTGKVYWAPRVSQSAIAM